MAACQPPLAHRWRLEIGEQYRKQTQSFCPFHTGDALMSPASPAPGTMAYAVLLFIMWWTMMLAMMLPSAAPAILTYGALSRKFAQKGAATAPVAVFVAGYAAIWTGFSAATVLLQMSVSKLVPLTGMMAVIGTGL